jgi:predicted house-cleaning noncanonical NTP pyrophosphatase (MazG superfamily)
MKVNKKQLEAMIRESVEEEISNLNEEELDELLGGLKGLAGAAGIGT